MSVDGAADGGHQSWRPSALAPAAPAAPEGCPTYQDDHLLDPDLRDILDLDLDDQPGCDHHTRHDSAGHDGGHHRERASRHAPDALRAVTGGGADPPAGGDPPAGRGEVPGGAGTAGGSAAAGMDFQTFFEAHHRELARFAYLLTGDQDAADDLTADALTAAWYRWDRVSSADSPLAYVRRMVANLATSRLRKVIRERNGMTMLSQLAEPAPVHDDVPTAVDLRAALMSLPAGKRACVVLRYAFDLSESETARTLGISVGTVKSQTSKGVAELERLLRPAPSRRPTPTVSADGGMSTTAMGSASPGRAGDRAADRSARRRSGHSGVSRSGASRTDAAAGGAAQRDPLHSGSSRIRRRRNEGSEQSGRSRASRSALSRLRDPELRPRLRGSET